MGYRSQVVIVISHELKVPADVENSLVEVFGVPRCVAENGDRLFAHDCIKWYSGFSDPEYADISRIEEYIKELDGDDVELALFHRIGEDYSDVDTAGSMWENEFLTEVVHEVRWSDPLEHNKAVDALVE